MTSVSPATFLTGNVQTRMIKRFDQVIVVVQVEEMRNDTPIWRDMQVNDLRYVSIKGELK